MRNTSKLYILPLVVTVLAVSASAREADVEAIPVATRVESGTAAYRCIDGAYPSPARRWSRSD